MLANGDLAAILRSRGFRRLLSVRMISQFGDGLFQAGLAVSILFNPEKRADPLAVATGFAILLLPYSMLGPYVGVFLDRWSRRHVLVYAQLIRAATVVPTAALIWYGRSTVIFALFALVVIGVNRFILAGLSAATPHVVEDRRLVTANALAPTLGTVCFSLGLGSAVLLQRLMPSGAHGYAVIALLAVPAYLSASNLARVSFRVDDLGPDEKERHPDGLFAEIVDVARGMVAGARHLAARRGAAYVMLTQTGFRALYGVLTVSTLLLYSNYFDTGTDFSNSLAGLGRLVIAGAVGSLVSAVVTPIVTKRIGGRLWVAGLVGAVGVAVLVFGLPFRAGMLIVAVFIINIASQGTKIVVDTALQHECADEYRGRVFSVNDTAFNMAFVLGLFLGALTLPETGKSVPVLVTIAIGYLLLAGWYGVAGGRWARRVGEDVASPGRLPTPPTTVHSGGGT